MKDKQSTASLTHVCLWKDNGWKPITAEEAARLHPGGTVSAHSGLFMCELCGQYVLLTDGDVQVRHFRHSSKEKSKDCPERTFGPGYSTRYSPKEHDLPIRIRVAALSFSFELGLIRVPSGSLGKGFCVEIKPKRENSQSFIYAKERLNVDGITYLYIGDRPYPKYSLSFKNGNKDLHDFWPKEIPGIDPAGTLFGKDSGKKLPYDADVEIKKEYYLLKRGNMPETPQGIKLIPKIMGKRFGLETWSLYLVSASDYGESAAKFFLQYHCRLTDHPVSMRPVWPLFVEGNYNIRHNQTSMYMLVEGYTSAFDTFPSAAYWKFDCDTADAKVYEVHCGGRQQLISAGRTKVLKYTYFWREDLDKTGVRPQVEVKDITGAEFGSGETYTLPKGKILRFNSDFDGELILYKNNRISEKLPVSAGKSIEIDGLAYGTAVQVVVGLDVIWEINFIRRKTFSTVGEDEILKQIAAVSGPTIAAPHSLRNILSEMNRYPRVCRWIRKCIKDGRINEQSYRRLQTACLNMNTKKQGDAL